MEIIVKMIEGKVNYIMMNVSALVNVDVPVVHLHKYFYFFVH